MDKIYLIIEGGYSDWSVVGYMTDKREAEKFCVANYDTYNEPYVVDADCFDGKCDLSNVGINYKHEVVFDKGDDGWVMRDEPWRYKFYPVDVDCCDSITLAPTERWKWIRVDVVQSAFDRTKAEEIAKDLLYEYLYEANSEFDYRVATEFNNMLAAPMEERKAIRESMQREREERAEYERIKAEYERLREKYGD